MRWLLALALFVSSTAAAQTIIAPPVDLSAYPKAADIPSLVINSIPFASTVPPMETPSGTAGSSTTVRRGDAIQPRITRTVTCVTVTGGTCAVTWAALPSVPTVFPIPVIASGGTQPIPCYPVSGTITTTGATIKCFQTQSILGLGLLPFTTGPAGVTVQVLAIPLS
jgi:hypothetical protein